MNNDLNHLFILSNNNLIEKNTNKLILQHPIETIKPLLNNDIINTNNIIMEIYGGNLVTLFNYDNMWYSLIDNQITNIIPIELNDIINELNINYYYLFMLNNNTLIKKYTKFNLIYIKQKYDLNEIIIEHKIMNKQKRLTFITLNEMHFFLDNITLNNNKSTKLTIEGIIVFINNTFIKIQTECYKNVIKLKPKNKNIHIGYLELYQKDLLLNYLPFNTEYSVDILKRINISLKTIAEEIFNLYYFIKNNTAIYVSLPDIYRYILNDINQKYKLKYPTHINIHYIYYFIKNLDINKIIDIYKNRYILEQHILFNKIINKNCIYTKTQVYLLSK
jgi:hypothetical protein